MTRVYTNPVAAAPGEPRLRALIIGAGRYPNAKGVTAKRPELTDLSSVGPSIRAFVEKLVRDWKDDLVAPLGSLDLLLSETQEPNGSQWRALGVPGEAPDTTAIDPPTLDNVNAALADALKGAETHDHFLFLCCGHGFWKEQRCFVLSDFGVNAPNPWTRVVLLDDFALGLRQEKPRQQWLFFDCCSDIPEQILKALSNIGDPLIQPNAEELAAAKKLGPLSHFGQASSTPGMQAFGIEGKPSRFCEMLVDALEGAGAVSKLKGNWCVDHRGIEDAFKSYPQRNPDLPDPDFYRFVTPVSSDMPGRMYIRRVGNEPKSWLTAFSKPKPAFKQADVVITPVGKDAPVFAKTPAGRAKLLIELPARLTCKVTARFGGNTKEVEVFSDLPLAEPAEVEFIL